MNKILLQFKLYYWRYKQTTNSLTIDTWIGWQVYVFHCNAHLNDGLKLIDRSHLKTKQNHYSVSEFTTKWTSFFRISPQFIWIRQNNISASVPSACVNSWKIRHLRCARTQTRTRAKQVSTATPEQRLVSGTCNNARALTIGIHRNKLPCNTMKGTQTRTNSYLYFNIDIDMGRHGVLSRTAWILQYKVLL